MKPKLEAVKVVGTEETETEAAVSVSNALSEVILVHTLHIDYSASSLESRIQK